jgi:ring-1,2-phenylacetyl-CoA epoxidase subunit PaaD
MLHRNTIWNIIKDIPDPEIPVISIAELGVLRDVVITDNGAIEVIITPTYSGCPAMTRFEDDIKTELLKNGYSNATIKKVFSPAWTTDWITDEARLKLLEYGISPPAGKADKSFLAAEPKHVLCPQCRSMNTEMISPFGSTACKAQWKCLDCLEPFDYFKCL